MSSSRVHALSYKRLDILWITHEQAMRACDCCGSIFGSPFRSIYWGFTYAQFYPIFLLINTSENLRAARIDTYHLSYRYLLMVIELICIEDSTDNNL